MSTPFGMPDNDNSDVLFAFTDIAGNPAVAPTIDPGSVIATASDPAAISVIPNADLSGVTCTADGPLDAAVTVDVSFTVAGVTWSGSEVFDVEASAPTTLTLVPQTPVNNVPLSSTEQIQVPGHPVGHTPSGHAPAPVQTTTTVTNA